MKMLFGLHAVIYCGVNEPDWIPSRQPPVFDFWSIIFLAEVPARGSKLVCSEQIFSARRSMKGKRCV